MRPFSITHAPLCLRRVAQSLLLLVLALILCLTLTPRSLAQSGPTVGDASFETVNVGPAGNFNSFQYNPAGSPWTFTGSAGISANNSGFTQGNPPAPNGGQVAVLENAGFFSQAVTFTAGTYTLSVVAAQRVTYN